MKRSRYRNKFLKGKSQTNRENYKIQWNICKKLLRKTKKSYFENLNTKKITDNRTFWKNAIPLSTRKVKLSLMKQRNISDEKKYAEILITYFQTLSQTLKYLVIGIFSTKKHTFSQLSLKRLKNTPVFSTLKKGNLIQYFHSERLLKKRYWKLSWI